MQSTQNMEPKKHKSGILGRSIIQLKFADDSKIVVCRELNKSRSHSISRLLCFFLSFFFLFQYCDASLHWHFRLLSVWWISFALIGQHDPQCHSQVKQYNAIIFGWKHTQAMCIAFVSFCVECDKFGATVNWRMFLHIYVYKSSRRIRVCVWEYDRRCRYGPTHHHTSGLPVAGVRLPVSVSRTCLKFKVSHRDFDNTQRRHTPVAVRPAVVSTIQNTHTCTVHRQRRRRRQAISNMGPTSLYHTTILHAWYIYSYRK